MTIVSTIVQSCPLIKRVINDPGLHFQLKYLQHHGSESRLKKVHIRSGIGSFDKLRAVIQSKASVDIEWRHGGTIIPEQATHLVVARNIPINVCAELNPARLTSIQSVDIKWHFVTANELSYVCLSYPRLKILKFLTSETNTAIVASILERFESLETLEYRVRGHANPISKSVFKYLVSGNASNLKWLCLAPVNIKMDDMLTVISACLKCLKFVKLVEGTNVVLRYNRAGLLIYWPVCHVDNIFHTFPKASKYHIKSPGHIKQSWPAVIASFARQRKCTIEVILDPQRKGFCGTEIIDNLVLTLQ